MDAGVAVRVVHLVGAALLVGGAVLAARLAWRGSVEAARAYEWLFWGALAAMVLTGLGNLGALGEALPRPGSAWGARFAWKVGALAVLLALSGVRALVVVMPDRPARASAWLLAVTAALLLATLALGALMAHG